MIKVMIKQAAKRRGIDTPAELARRVGIQERVAGRWWKTDTKGVLPRLQSLDAICKAFDKVEPCSLNELIKWIPNGKKGRKRG